MFRSLLLSILLSIFLISTQVYAHEWQIKRADSHAPIGVKGHHTHNSGEIMFSYPFMSMSMSGNRSGRTDQSVSDVLSDFMVAPLDMSMSMHMLGSMYAPTDKITLMAMVPYINKSMNHRKRDLTDFNRAASGIGDVKVSALYQLVKDKGQRLHLNTGVSVPVGSINEKDGQSTRLPYPMQLGSGTYDMHLGATYATQLSEWSFGTQASSIIRLGKNKYDYALGNSYKGNIWVAKPFTSSLSTSLRAQANIWEDISGSDSDLNPMMVPTAKTNTGGKKVDLSVGLNYAVNEGSLKGNRIGFEVGLPVFQSFNGTQMNTEYWVSVGWQYSPK